MPYTFDVVSTVNGTLSLPSPVSSLRCASSSLQTSWISGYISFNFPDVKPGVSLDLTSFHLENIKLLNLGKTVNTEANGTKAQKFKQVLDVIVRWVRPLPIPTADFRKKHMDVTLPSCSF